MSADTSSYTICSAPNVYMFVYILIETRIAPLTGLLTTLLLLAGRDSAALPPRSSITRSNHPAPALTSDFPRHLMTGVMRGTAIPIIPPNTLPRPEPYYELYPLKTGSPPTWCTVLLMFCT